MVFAGSHLSRPLRQQSPIRYEHNAEFSHGDGAHRQRSRHRTSRRAASVAFFRGGENRQESRRQNDEVAILAVSTRWRHLHFLVPDALKNVGFIPLSSNSALAVRTARDSRPEIENNFATSLYPTIVETVKISADAASRK